MHFQMFVCGFVDFEPFQTYPEDTLTLSKLHKKMCFGKNNILMIYIQSKTRRLPEIFDVCKGFKEYTNIVLSLGWVAVSGCFLHDKTMLQQP